VSPRKPEPAEESVAFRVAVLIALMIAGCAAVAQGVGGPVLWFAVLVGYPAAFFVAYMTRHNRPPVLRAVVTGVAAVVLVFFVASITSQPLVGFAALQLPLTEVFVWLMMLHALDSPGRRGLFISLLASVVLIAIAGVLSISMGVAPYILLWAVAAITALVLGQRAELATLPALSDVPPRRSRVITRGAVAVGVSMLVVLVLGAAIFMVAPVAGTDRALTFPAQLPNSQSVPLAGGLSNPSLGRDDPAASARPGQSRGGRASFGYVGFANQLDTSVRGRPDDTLVMRVRAAAPDFWRAQSFDLWNGRVWRSSLTKTRVLRGPQPLPVAPAADEGPQYGIVPTDELVQTYYVEKPGPNSIFAAATPTRLYFPDRVAFQLPDGSLRAAVQLDKDSVYTVVSQRLRVTEDVLRASYDVVMPPIISAIYAQPPVITPRVRALAARVTANAPTAYDKVRALERWMATHTKYTLDIPRLPRGKDAVDQFLFVDKRGFCEQIGTSLVVMLRSLGIPARLTVGYATGERNPFTGLYEVRAKDAHAWAEVYFPGVGWQGFDPTAEVPLAGDSAISGAGAGALAYLETRVSVPSWLPAVLIVIGMAIVVGLFVGAGARRARRRRRIPPPTWAGTRLARLDAFGARRGRARSPGETTPEYTRALAHLDPSVEDSLATVARVLDEDAFSGVAAGADERAEVDELLDELAARPVR
jgi:transglutaminase-like putative cysteine protease